MITRDPDRPVGGTYDGRHPIRTLRSPDSPNPPIIGGKQLTGPVGIELEPEDVRRRPRTLNLKETA